MDKTLVKRHFSHAAETYDDYAVLHEKIAAEVAIKTTQYIQTGNILEIGCGTGFLTKALSKIPNDLKLLQTDIAEEMCKVAARKNQTDTICCDAEQLPFKDASFDGFVSVSAFQWIADLKTAFTEAGRILKNEGILVISAFGPGTLSELQHVLSVSGEPSRLSKLHSLGDIKNAAQNAGLHVLESGSAQKRLSYPTFDELLKSVKNIGASGKSKTRHRGLLTPKKLAAMRNEYTELYSENGVISASWEVIGIICRKTWKS